MWVDADPVRLAQIFTNILFNAGKYTEHGGSISLTLRRERDRALIEITDTGIGISKEMLGRIFDPFVQDSRIDDVGTGLGIGLSIAKRLVELHGGAISATSEGRNRGSTFRIVLLIHELRAQKTEPPAYDALKPASVLVVDDNQDAANSIARLLRTKGHTVEAVFSGKEALAAMTSKPSFVLLDIGLPDMQGYSVAKKIRTESPRTVVIALSGFGSTTDKHKAAEAGIALHLTKPASLRDIEMAMSHKMI
jgi:CheY-like chemotaxis protein